MDVWDHHSAIVLSEEVQHRIYGSNSFQQEQRKLLKLQYGQKSPAASLYHSIWNKKIPVKVVILRVHLRKAKRTTISKVSLY
uniref:Uncharacterized protein n=1 Tax=Wuchereria bancrofti TaxID=6293 RepID=A0A1I8EW02_WUCBA